MDFICFSTQHKIHWPGFPLSQGLGFNYRYFHIPGHEDFAAAFPLLFLGIVWLSHLALHWEFTSRCQVHMNELLFWELQKEKKNPLNKLLNSFCWTIPQVAGVNAFTKLLRTANAVPALLVLQRNLRGGAEAISSFIHTISLSHVSEASPLQRLPFRTPILYFSEESAHCEVAK